MKPEVLVLWDRACRTIESAASLTDTDPDSSASRAYYAAFYAVSALFAARGKGFRKHKAVEVAVHLDLVKSGEWPEDLGTSFSRLVRLRSTGDYGMEERVSPGEARSAVSEARRIIQAVRDALPGLEANEEDQS